jgi:hypothetical protein
MPKSAERIIEDVLLTPYACYLIVQNGNRGTDIPYVRAHSHAGLSTPLLLPMGMSAFPGDKVAEPSRLCAVKMTALLSAKHCLFLYRR